LFYLLYKLIFEFIIPVYNATSQVKKKVGEMQQENNFTTPPKQSSTEKPKRNDYIDFEDVNNGV